MEWPLIVIMDNGTDFFKAGFSGNRVLPTVTLPCTETNSVLPHHFLYEKERIESGPAKQTRPLMKRHCWMDVSQNITPECRDTI